MFCLVAITKEEAREIRKYYPEAVSKSCRLKRNYRGHFYLAEDKKYLDLLDKIRGGKKVVFTYGEN